MITIIKITLWILCINILNSAWATQDFMVRPYAKQGSIELEVKPIDLSGGAIKHTYTPNPGTTTGIYLKYKMLGISLGTNAAPSEEEIQLKGETTFSDYQFHFAFSQIGFDFYYQKYRGFYRSSATDSEMVGSPEHFPFLENLQQEVMGINIFYIKSPKDFSYEAAFNQSEVQKKSGGSLLLFLSLNKFDINNDSAILPAAQQALYGELGTFSGLTVKTVGTIIGWGYSLVINRMFVSTVIGVGPGYQQSSYAGVENGDISGAITRATARISLGYNGPAYFGGMSILIDSTQSLSDHMEVTPSSRLVELFMGMRF